MPDEWRHRQPGRGMRNSRPQAHVWAAVIMMGPPHVQRRNRWVSVSGMRKFQVLAAETAEETLAYRVGLGRLDRCSEGADPHRRDGRVEPWRVEACRDRGAQSGKRVASRGPPETAAGSTTRFRTNVRQRCVGAPRRVPPVPSGMSCRTVRGDTRRPSFMRSSAAMRRSPQVGLSCAIARISWRGAAGIRGRPRLQDRHRHHRRNAWRCQRIPGSCETGPRWRRTAGHRPPRWPPRDRNASATQFPAYVFLPGWSSQRKRLGFSFCLTYPGHLR